MLKKVHDELTLTRTHRHPVYLSLRLLRIWVPGSLHTEPFVPAAFIYSLSTADDKVPTRKRGQAEAQRRPSSLPAAVPPTTDRFRPGVWGVYSLSEVSSPPSLIDLRSSNAHYTSQPPASDTMSSFYFWYPYISHPTSHSHYPFFPHSLPQTTLSLF